MKKIFLLALVMLCTPLAAKATMLSSPIHWKLYDLSKEMVKDVDTVENITTIRHKLVRSAMNEHDSLFQLWIRDDGFVSLPYLIAGYSTRRWVMMNQLVINIDGTVSRLDIDPEAVSRGHYAKANFSKAITAGIINGIHNGLRIPNYTFIDTNDYIYLEWAEIYPRKIEDIQGMGRLIRAIANGEDIVVRLKGRKGRTDFRLTQDQKTALIQTWRYYELTHNIPADAKPSEDYNAKIKEYIGVYFKNRR